MKTILYDFSWSDQQDQGLWATDEKGEPTVMIECAVREIDEDDYRFEEDPTYRDYGEPTAEYLLAENINFEIGEGVLDDKGEILWGKTAERFIEARAMLSNTCKPINLDP
jgi:hypothetical protein